jgi:quercetin dioxygenase-like cupin family protein
MAIHHAQPGEVIDVRPLGAALESAVTTTLLKSDHLELIRLVMAAGKEIPPHKAKGEITVQCLEGKLEFTALEKTQELTAGKLLYLPAGELHSLKCLEACSLLLTIVRGA